LGFEPLDDIGVQSDGYGLLDRSVHLPAYTSAQLLVGELWNI